MLERALNDATRFGNGTTTAPAGDGPSILRNVNTNDLVKRTGTVYQALDLLGAACVPSAGARTSSSSPPASPIAMKSCSPAACSPAAAAISTRQSNRSTRRTSRSTASSCSATPTRPRSFTSASKSSLQSTGGRYFRLNVGFNPALEQIEKTNNGYYLVTYRSSRPQGETGFQKVNVTTKNREFKVVSRSGYSRQPSQL